MHILLINPNTSQGITDKMLDKLRTRAPAGVELSGCTASFGAPYISDELSYAVANHSTVKAYQDFKGKPVDAVLIACFGDPGLFALKEISRGFVTGLAEASFAQAASHGPFAVVTGGAKWQPMLQRLAEALGYGALLSHIETVEASGAQLAADPQAAQTLLADACHRALAQLSTAGAPRSVIVGGAGLVGFADMLGAKVPCTLIDSVYAGLESCLAAKGR